MLAWLGRHGQRAIAVSFALSIALPPLGERLAPWLPEAVFLILCLAFLRIDIESALAHRRDPVWPLAAVAWTSLAVPALIGALMLLTGLVMGIALNYYVTLSRGSARATDQTREEMSGVSVSSRSSTS